jgi:hypothetical protein
VTLRKPIHRATKATTRIPLTTSILYPITIYLTNIAFSTTLTIPLITNKFFTNPLLLFNSTNIIISTLIVPRKTLLVLRTIRIVYPDSLRRSKTPKLRFRYPGRAGIYFVYTRARGRRTLRLYFIIYRSRVFTSLKFTVSQRLLYI